MASNQSGAAQQDFESQARYYDELIPKLVPFYHQQTQILLDLIPFPISRPIRVLELGIGTGTLAEAVLQRFPHSRIHGIDYAANMLAWCRHRLSPYGDRLTLEPLDFAEYQATQGDEYDLVISGLAIHHLTDDQKKNLYQELPRSLGADGIVLIRDLVKAPTERLETLYDSLWRTFIRSHGEDDELWCRKHQEKDHPALLGEQLRWLENAGLCYVDCHWKYLQFAIFGGRRDECGS
ncbi:MAG: methyltransferase domain-containing protein [Oscillatoriales cyanobacterium SM2_2_1]|nr:methyltransferase domain-containing protein [Oscillatoriales cyanobacterium SM2_2_1]